MNAHTSATQAHSGVLRFHSIPILSTAKNVIQAICGAVTAYQHTEKAPEPQQPEP